MKVAVDAREVSIPRTWVGMHIVARWNAASDEERLLPTHVERKLQLVVAIFEYNLGSL